MYELFEHTADVGLRIEANDLPGLFAESGKALFTLITGDLNVVRRLNKRTWKIVGSQRDYLLFDWLNELLYCFDHDRLLLREFSIEFHPGWLRGTAEGELVDVKRHSLEHEVKAITYHRLKVVRHNTGWLAEVIVDI